MGLFGGGGKGGGGFSLGNFLQRLGDAGAVGQAALEGDYTAGARLRETRRRSQLAEDEAEALRRQRQQQIEAASQIAGPNGRPMFSKQQLNTLNADDLSGLVRTYSAPWDTGSEGGSRGMWNSETGNMEFTNAPRSYTDEGRVFQIDPRGNSRQVLDAREGDIHWQTGPWGAFSTDSRGRQIPPGTNIQSPMGQDGQQPQMQQGQPQQPGATPTSAVGGDFPSRLGAAFAQAGLPAPVIAGILGNAHHESGGQWNAAVGDGGTSHGAFQWRNERAQNFQRIVGVSPNEATPEQTAQFVMWELQNPQAAGMTQGQVQAILRAPTPEAAARLFSQHYERPNARLANNNSRAALANQYAGGTQFAQGGAPNLPGQGRSIQDQAAQGMVTAPRDPGQGYNWTPEGNLQAIPGGGAAQQQQQAIGQVIQQARSDPVAQQWQAARTSTMQLQRLGETGRASDDVAMIFSFMRALDPNSTVREGEFATAQNTAGIPDRLRNYYNQARQGTLLGPQQRREFVSTAGRLYTERSRAYNDHIGSYHRQLQSMGVENPAEFIPIAMAPITEERQRRERERQQRENPVDPNDVMNTVRQAQEAMVPGQPQGFRILRRRRR